MTQSLKKQFKEEIYSYLRIPGNFFSLIMDKTIDIWAIRECAFTVMFYFSEIAQLSTNFFDMVEVEST